MTRSELRSGGTAALAALALLACSSRLPDGAPRPSAMVPATGYESTPTDVVIQGAGFRVEPYQSASGTPAVDATFRAWLDGTELTDVRWIGERELRARVPAGLPVGSHRLVVSDPRGGVGALDGAFTVLLADEAVQVISDPFGDGATSSLVFGYAGHVFLGPSADGSAVVRCSPVGTGCGSFALSFARDTTEWVTRGGVTVQTSLAANACPDLTTIGAQPYCSADAPASTACACGPDHESGRGVFAAVGLGAAAQDEWLVGAGRSKASGALKHVYMTSDTAPPLRFSYVDLGVALVPSTAVLGVAATAVLQDRLYLGLAAAGGDRPRVAVLTSAPAAPGLDAIPAEAYPLTFAGTPLDETGGADPLSQVDGLLGFEGRLFVATRMGVLVSKDGAPPADWPGAAARFDDCTPTDPAAWATTSVRFDPASLEPTPVDRAVTGLVEWKGRLYLARNTVELVPELWAFTPRHDELTGQFLGCAADRSDWRRIATNFRDAANTRLSVLFASGQHLYAGYDAVAGVQLWRTPYPDPSGEASFTGRLGCVPFTLGDGGAPCAPVGGSGFGDPLDTRFFDARALSYGGGDRVWATVGSGSSAVRVFRISE